MISETIRRQGFWLYDAIKGGEVRRHYREIDSINRQKECYEKFVNGRLTALLDNAVKHCVYYTELRSYDTLFDFPVINKNTIKENYEKFLSKKFVHKDLHSMSTSGSTGTPFTILQDRNKRNRVLAEIIYFGKLAGYRLGYRHVFFKAWTTQNRKSRLQAFKQNMLMLDISVLDESNLANIRSILKTDKRIKCILGIAYSLDVISRYLLDKGDTPEMFSLEIVISGAEVLQDETRSNLERVFGCDVVSRYSNQENGIIGQEPIAEEYFVLNQASYYLEFLKLDGNEAAEEGELSRIVITDLFNFAMPLIRYDTGDLGIAKNIDKYGTVLTSIEGKVVDFIYSTKGTLISPVSVAVNLRDIPNYFHLKQFQLIQDSKYHYTMKLNGAEGLFEDGELVCNLKRLLGDDALIQIEHVEGIPTLRSGKFKKVVCNYNPQ